MRLEATGFVTSEPRLGMVVAGNTVESLSEIYEVSEVLEGFAAQLASHYARPSDLVAMRATLNELAVATENHDIPRLRALNSRFHEQIHIAARNDQLRRTLRHMLNLIRLSPVSAYAIPGRAEDSLAEHWEMLKAIEAGDKDAGGHPRPRSQAAGQGVPPVADDYGDRVDRAVARNSTRVGLRWAGCFSAPRWNQPAR